MNKNEMKILLDEDLNCKVINKHKLGLRRTQEIMTILLISYQFNLRFLRKYSESRSLKLVFWYL